MQSSHSKYFSSPTALKRRVEFSDTFLKLKFPDMVEDCRFKMEKSQKQFNSIVTEWTLSVSFRVLMRWCHILLFLVNLRFLYDKDEAVWSIIKIFLVQQQQNWDNSAES